MIIQWLAFGFFLAAALVHIGFFIFEWFLLKAQPDVKIWAKNQAVYNLCVALGTLVGLYYVLQLEVRIAGIVTSLFGVFMIVAGVTLWFTAPRYRKLACLQAGLPILGFICLAIHILHRMGRL